MDGLGTVCVHFCIDGFHKESSQNLEYSFEILMILIPFRSTFPGVPAVSRIYNIQNRVEEDKAPVVGGFAFMSAYNVLVETWNLVVSVLHAMPRPVGEHGLHYYLCVWGTHLHLLEVYVMRTGADLLHGCPEANRV